MSHKKNRQTRDRRPSRTRLRNIENLESKIYFAGDLVPSASVDLNPDDGVLTIIADVNGSEAEVTLEAGPMHELVVVELDDRRHEFPRHEVMSIVFDGSAADDVFRNYTWISTTARGGDGHDVVEGGEGIDTLEGGAGNDFLQGNGGDDTYVFRGRGLGEDTIYEPANVGQDTLDFSEFGARLERLDLRILDLDAYGGIPNVAGSDLDINFHGNAEGIENVIGTPFDDFVEGNNRNNRLEGGAGNDFLQGNGGDDTYVFRGRGLGEDTIYEPANVGQDTLDFSEFGARLERLDLRILDLDAYGGIPNVAGSDLDINFHGNAEGIENVIGTPFDDFVEGNNRNNRLEGGAGNDILQGNVGGDDLFGGSGADVLLGGVGPDELHGGDGDDDISGGAATDYIFGEECNDRLWGNEGNDTIVGGEGADDIFGEEGFDFTRELQDIDRINYPDGNRISGYVLAHGEAVDQPAFLATPGGLDCAPLDVPSGDDIVVPPSCISGTLLVEGAVPINRDPRITAILGDGDDRAMHISDVVQPAGVSTSACAFSAVLSSLATTSFDLALGIRYAGVNNDGSYRYMVKIHDVTIDDYGYVTHVSDTPNEIEVKFNDTGEWNRPGDFWKGDDPNEQGRETWAFIYNRAFTDRYGIDDPIRKNMGAAFSAITGKVGIWADITHTRLIDAIRINLEQGNVVTVGSRDAGTSHGIVPNHAYSIVDIEGVGIDATIKLRNPWGEQPSDYPDAQEYTKLSWLEFVANFAQEDTVELFAGVIG